MLVNICSMNQTMIQAIQFKYIDPTNLRINQDNIRLVHILRSFETNYEEYPLIFG